MFFDAGCDLSQGGFVEEGQIHHLIASRGVAFKVAAARAEVHHLDLDQSDAGVSRQRRGVLVSGDR